MNHNGTTTENALQLAVEDKADIMLVQEPAIYDDEEGDFTNARSTNHSGYTQIFPKYSNLTLRPRVMAYVAKTFKPSISPAVLSPDDPDFMLLEITEKGKKLFIINIYNEKDRDQGTNKNTAERCLYSLPYIPQNTLLIGDFNTHHPWWEPSCDKTTARADKLEDWLDEEEFFLLNKPGKATFSRKNTKKTSVLDLAFVTESLSEQTDGWKVNTAFGSDHYGLHVTLLGENSDMVDNPLTQMRFSTKKADWIKFDDTLRKDDTLKNLLSDPIFDRKQVPRPESLNMLNGSNKDVEDILEEAATRLTNAIVNASKASMPLLKAGLIAKPWWTEELKESRKEMVHRQNEIRIDDPSTYRTYIRAKNSYFTKIKNAKRDHWNAFLEKEDPQSIYKAMSYTKSTKVQRIPHIQNKDKVLQTTFEGKCDAFREKLFPPPPEREMPNFENYNPPERAWEWPSTTNEEVRAACSNEVQSKSPGPDGITQEIIIRAYIAMPKEMNTIFAALTDIGYHPKIWRQATGAILKKPNKPDDSLPKAYRVITLLNCLGKVSERIIAKRLGFLAETTHLIHPSQMGGRLKKSAVDAALLLTNDIELAKRKNHKTSVLFMDVQNAYGHVIPSQLYKILKDLKLPTNLISWIKSFLSNRYLRIAFDGEMEEFLSTEAGIPQGSPISPILFLIYIRVLFKSTGVTHLSYVDDLTLSTSSTSLRKNVQTLEREAEKLCQIAAQGGIEFDIDKTELMHFTGSRDAINHPVRLPDGKTIQPLQSVKWLGIHFDPHLNFKHHVAVRTAKAKNAFHRMTRLANTERGLSPFAMRQIYIACVTSVADYGSIIWWRGQKMFSSALQKLQNMALRKILGVFKTAPIRPMEIEAAIPPAEVRLNSNLRMYAFRLAKLAPSHPVNKATRLLTEPTETRRRSTPVQLEKIHAIVPSRYRNENLEKIQHFYFAPWKKTRPWTFRISKLTKEEEAKAHVEFLQSDLTNATTIYTDASTMSKGKGVGVGLVAIEQLWGEEVHSRSVNIGPNNLTYNGELEGATQGIEYAAEHATPGHHFYIFSDNQAGLYRLDKPSDNPGQECQIRAFKAGQKAIEKGAQITLSWVPGHQDVTGNEIADSLAKEGTKKRPIRGDTSFAVMGMELKRDRIADWMRMLQKEDTRPASSPYSYRKIFNWKIKSKISLPANTKRNTASAFFQLKLGHGYIKEYLHRLNHTDDDRCRCGAEETPRHLLLRCPETRDARKELRKALKNQILTMRLLLHTTEGIKHTITFLNTTKIATRGWHLARNIDEEEEAREAIRQRARTDALDEVEDESGSESGSDVAGGSGDES